LLSYITCGRLFSGASTVRWTWRPHTVDNRPIFEFRGMGGGTGEVSVTILPRLIDNGPRFTLFCHESLDDIRAALVQVGYDDHDFETFMTPFPAPLPVTCRRRVCCHCDGEVRWHLFAIRVLFLPAFLAMLLTWELIVDENTASPLVSSYRLLQRRQQWYSSVLPAIVTFILFAMLCKILYLLLCARKIRIPTGAVAPLLGVAHLPIVPAAPGVPAVGGIGHAPALVAAAAAAGAAAAAAGLLNHPNGHAPHHSHGHHDGDGSAHNFRMFSGDDATRRRIFALLPVAHIAPVAPGVPEVPLAALASPIAESVTLLDDARQQLRIHAEEKWE
jgi:hypothetical protein